MSQENKPVELSPEAKKAIQSQQVADKVKELQTISRLAVNTMNLICSNDVKIPSAYAKPVSEIQDWLTGMHKAVQDQVNMLRPLLSVQDAETLFGKAVAVPASEAPTVDAETPKAVKLELAPQA